jgi:hypothetical protein
MAPENTTNTEAPAWLTAESTWHMKDFWKDFFSQRIEILKRLGSFNRTTSL